MDIPNFTLLDPLVGNRLARLQRMIQMLGVVTEADRKIQILATCSLLALGEPKSKIPRQPLAGMIVVSYRQHA